jgi:hypothetical protein
MMAQMAKKEDSTEKARLSSCLTVAIVVIAKQQLARGNDFHSTEG